VAPLKKGILLWAVRVHTLDNAGDFFAYGSPTSRFMNASVERALELRDELREKGYPGAEVTRVKVTMEEVE